MSVRSRDEDIPRRNAGLFRGQFARFVNLPPHDAQKVADDDCDLNLTVTEDQRLREQVVVDSR